MASDVRLKAGDEIEGPDGFPIHVLSDQLNMITPLKEAERLALTESIQTHGVMVPVMISLGPTRGRIVDGFNRWEICQEFNMPCPASFTEFASVEDEDAMALGLNVQRRQLDDFSAGMVNKRLLELRGILGRGRRSLSGLTVADVAREAGQTERTFYRRLEMANLLTREDCLDIRDAFQSEELTATEALTLARARKKAVAEGTLLDPSMDRTRALKEIVEVLRRSKELSPTEQSRMEAFTEGVKWGYEAATTNKAEPDWVLEQLNGWRESVLMREQEERRLRAQKRLERESKDEPDA